LSQNRVQRQALAYIEIKLPVPIYLVNFLSARRLSITGSIKFDNPVLKILVGYALFIFTYIEMNEIKEYRSASNKF
jgi:hypothetical protein